MQNEYHTFSTQKLQNQKPGRSHYAGILLDIWIKNYIDRSRCRLIFFEGKAMD